MIPTAKLASLTTTLATDSAATTTAEAPATPFDAILSLETFAATCTVTDPLMGLGPQGPCGAEFSPTEFGDSDDSDDKDLAEDEDPLEFLADLLSAAAVVPRPATQSGAADGGTDDAVGDALSGHARHATSASEGEPSIPSPASVADAAKFVIPAGMNSVDAATAQQLLAAADPAKTTEDGRVDAAQSTDSNTAALARAAEMLAHGPRHAAPTVKDHIPTPVRDPNWGQDLGARVTLMVRGGESTASLQLAPAELGPVDVNVVVKDSQATVHFGAAQAETRALIEASIPRLREMLAAQGFNLMDASVSQGFARQAKSDLPTISRGDVEPDSDILTTARINPAGLLDTYA